MARKVTRLTDTEVKAAKARAKLYVLSDGEGLQLRVKTNGSRLWNFNYTHPFTNKRVNMGLGKYPDLSLANARKKTVAARELLAQGIDPKEHREQAILDAKAITENTLFNTAKHWFELKKDSVTAPYAKDVWRSLEIYIFPELGQIPLSRINAPLVIQTLRPVEAKGSLETLKRLSQRLNEIMVYAVNCGIIHANPLSGIKQGFKKPKKVNMPSITPQELPDLMLAVANASIKKTTRFLLEWQLHTMTRPSEAAGTSWAEINLIDKVWTIPAKRMKKRREHTVPLTEAMLNLLEAIKPISGHREYVFPADRNPKMHCNSQTVNMAIKRMGFHGKLVSHGLRSLASTTLNEQGFESDLIEAALAHVDDSQVRSAYNRTDYLERRRPMMEWWSKHIEAACSGSLSITGYKGLKITA
ncbi:MAG: tyrosine-type recombinase/integrase [Alteromonadaceae bacterium]|nr:tyrosine-type recombinase/integrase [Alteromonadaceae bacterium]MBL4909353.1 tyrosine-type recombinase/integrase [Alteromonadaceae bacterium]